MLTFLGIAVKDERGVGAWVLGVFTGSAVTVILVAAALDLKPEHVTEAIRWELAECASRHDRTRQLIER